LKLANVLAVFDFGGELEAKKEFELHDEGALAEEMNERTTTVRTVYEFPVAGHVCSDGSVRYVKLVRRGGQQPEGVCATCQTSFQYRKPKPSSVRHSDGEGITHF
jgi:hypothetical protein